MEIKLKEEQNMKEQLPVGRQVKWHNPVSFKLFHVYNILKILNSLFLAFFLQ